MTNNDASIANCENIGQCHLVDELSARTPPAQQDWVGIYHLLTGETDKAYESFQLEHNQSRSYWSGFHVILLAEERGDRATRDAVMNFLTNPGVPAQTDSLYALGKFAALLRAAFAEATPGQLDLKSLDQTLEAASENQRMDICYFAAKFLFLRGRDEVALTYLNRCYSSTDIGQLNRTLAGAELIARGVSLQDLKSADEL